MISLEQILLLEKKVESAVAKIAQLQAENDALRTKCSELTNALSSKSEQLSSFENDQNKIESGILKALDRLSSIENSVLKVVQNNTEAQELSENHITSENNTASQTVSENYTTKPEADTSVSSEPEADYENTAVSEDVYSQEIAEETEEEETVSSINPYAVNSNYSEKQFYDMQPAAPDEDNYADDINQDYSEDQGNPEDDQTDDNGQFDIF